MVAVTFVAALGMRIFGRGGLGLSLAVVLACGGDGGAAEDPTAWQSEAGTSGGAGTGIDSGSTTDSDETGSDDAEETDGDPTDGETTDGESTGGEPIDCTPAWVTPWIGSPCAGDDDCSFEGGACLTPADGFPCGTCTLDCTTNCPDTEGAPVTYCINGTDVGLADAGYCLSKCDEDLLPGEGCRDGYVCDVLARFDDSDSDGVCIPEEFDDMDPLVSVIDHEFLIRHFGGDPVDALDYGPDVDSFQMYLDDVGVQYTSAAEIVEPYNQAAATGCGFDILLPERDQWEKAAALALFTDVLTELVGEPIFMRNWWRPPCYNDAVGGAPGGDHPDADAVDLDFASATSRAIAQKFLCETYWDQDIVPPEQIDPTSNLDPRLNMSVGLGGITIHLGVLSQGGRRFWFYDTYTDEPNSGTCW